MQHSDYPMNFEDKKISIRAVGGCLQSVGVVVLPLDFGSYTVRDVSFVVVPDEAMSCCLLLGINGISDIGLVVDFEKKSVHIQLASNITGSIPFIPSVSAESGVVLCIGAEERAGILSCLSQNNLQLLQQADPELAELKQFVLCGNSHSKLPSMLKKFSSAIARVSIREGLLFFARNGSFVPVVSFVFAVEVVIHLHWQNSHPGRNKLTDLV